ncbi:MAG TPA: phosphatase PAP2 family protein [Acidimicrobiales bacterium]|nr:phosphatase PAP2 family protein [Acidimicrobiales bacterium]
MIEAPLQESQILTEPSENPATSKSKRTPIFVELAWVVFLVWIYNWIQDFAPLRREQAFSNARAILSFEMRTGLDPERVLDHWLAYQHVLAYVASNFYGIAIFAVTFGFAAWTWLRRPDIYVPLRNEIVLANLIAFAVFWAFPVAPPRMLPGFIDVVAKAGGLGWHNTLVRHADQLAAMPSMHLGYAVWCSLVAWRLARSRASKAVALVFGLSYPLLTALAVMATANHYLVDVLAGVATTVASVVVVEVVPHRLHRRRTNPSETTWAHLGDAGPIPVSSSKSAWNGAASVRGRLPDNGQPTYERKDRGASRERCATTAKASNQGDLSG